MSARPLAQGPLRLPARETTAEAVQPAETGFRLVLPVVIVALAVGAAATVWSFLGHAVLAYGDAQQHLEIARRVLDSRTPGAAQLGTVWLPLPHVLLMLFVYADPLWRTGLAGSILGVACLAITAASLFLVVLEVVGRKSMAWIAVAVLLANPNVLYVYTTALTEPVLFASMMASTYFLFRWGARRRWPDLITAGMLAGAAVLSRYEGWALAAAGAALVSWMAYFATLDRRQAEGATLAFVVPPVYAMGLWAFYNWVIFGDPLGFARGQFSAQAQAQAAVGGAPTKGQVLLSFMTYSWAAIDTIKWPVLGAAIVGLLVYVARTRLRAASLLPYIFVALFCFDVLLLFLGQIQLVTPQSAPAGIFNIRYSLVIILGAAFFVAYLAASLAKLIKPGFVIMLVSMLLVAQAALYIPNWPASMIVLNEALHGTVANPATFAVARYLRTHYDGGGILVDESSAGFMTPAGIHMKEYIGTFSGQLFLQALRDPGKLVRWVVINTKNPNDRVGSVLAASPSFHSQFRLARSIGGFEIYESKK
ncbi:MAG: glycosyltransferase family 39 protein [Chloroflexota bacterium]